MSATFQALGIDESWCGVLRQLGIGEPTPIQSMAIPQILADHNVIAESPTGTGKTLAYVLPVLQRIDTASKHLQAIVLTPTRELAVQIMHVIESLIASGESTLRVQSLIGGAALSRQVDKLKEHPHIVVGTPGRIAELLEMRKLSVHYVRTAVIDEADQVFALGSSEDVDRVLRGMQRDRQLLFFSATITDAARQAAEDRMTDPKLVSPSAGSKTAPGIEHAYVVCDPRSKIDTLRRLVHACKPTRAIVFANANADMPDLLAKLQHVGLPVYALHGDVGKADRAQTLQAFRAGKFGLLLATDVAARGLDIEGVTHIFHLDLPMNSEAYVHRVGRTGRMGKSGTAVSVVTPRELWILEKIAKQVGVAISHMDIFGGKLIPHGSGKGEQRRNTGAGGAVKTSGTRPLDMKQGEVEPRSSKPGNAKPSNAKPSNAKPGNVKPDAPKQGAGKRGQSAKSNNKDKGAPKWLKAKRDGDVR